MKKKIVCILFTFILLFTLSSCTSYPEETRMAKEYLGMTFGEIKALWGKDCTLGGDLYDGAEKGVGYADERTPYLFFFEEPVSDLSALSDDAVVTRVRAPGSNGIPCETITSGETYKSIADRYYTCNYQQTETYFVWSVRSEKETMSVDFFFTLAEEYNENHQNPTRAYEVYTTPKELQRKEYYIETDEAERGFFFTFDAWPSENWDKVTMPDGGTMSYYYEHGEWPDPAAITYFIDTGIWPENTELPYPYTDIARVEFYGVFGFWPPENWVKDKWPDNGTISYFCDYGEWPDPDALDEFMESGLWPDDAYVPYPYSDPVLLNIYEGSGHQWPEGTDLSELPPLPNK